MIRRAGLAAVLALAPAAAATACPPPSATLLVHSCWGTARAEIVILPEDSVPPPGDARRRLVVTGTYTATDTRERGAAKPVGLAIDGGRVVNPNLARMDGILIVRPDGGLRLVTRAAARLGGRIHDLRRLGDRRAFTRRAQSAGVSVLQSHLLVIEGESDVAARPDAPAAPRRMLFTDAHGWGVYRTPGAETLHGAAEAILAAHAPRMVFNLDMGGHDLCRLTVAGETRPCGLRGAEDLEGLSNLLVLTLD